MGWAAMKGDIFDPLVVFLAFFVFIWQMPHFWMLMLKYGNEYRNAGFPVLTDIFSPFQIKAIVMFWIIASSTVSMMFVFFNVIQLRYIGFGMLGVNIVLVLLMIWQFYLAKQMNYRMIFMSANFYILAILLLIIADHLIR
jgi:protoheme IX farnesyltransferase